MSIEKLDTITTEAINKNIKNCDSRIIMNEERFKSALITSNEFKRIESEILREQIIYLKAKNRRTEKKLFN